MMRNRFDEQLETLNSALLEMGAYLEDAIGQSVKALETRDVDAARKIAKSDDVIDNKEKEIENLCLKLLLQQQPVARDLHLISAALKMITDMERIGDHATDISELVIMMDGAQYLSDLDDIYTMAAVASSMLTDSIDAFVERSEEKAHIVCRRDDEVDKLFVTVKEELIENIRKNPQCGEQAMDLLMVAKYFERIGDHAVNIAEWVVFSITGVHKSESEI